MTTQTSMWLSLVLALPVLTATQAVHAAAAPNVDLSGFWERRDTQGGGSFGGMLASLPKAVLVPDFVPPRAPSTQVDPPSTGKPNAVGVPYIVTTGNCSTSASLNIPFMMTHSTPIDIVQGADEILIVPEMPGAQRIYMDGRAHPATGRVAPTGLGHSVGRWEGNELVVHTVGMSAGGGIPGGGFRTPETELTQRWRLKEGGAQLEVEFTWVDPKIYAKPHTFSLTYFRMPQSTYALEEWCDSGDPLQRQSIVPPKQD
ncbi:MAG: hypothetical protein ABL964_04095 [Steroidobacteraceae bacterium]